jgi:hypothetical protein
MGWAESFSGGHTTARLMHVAFVAFATVAETGHLKSDNLKGRRVLRVFPIQPFLQAF